MHFTVIGIPDKSDFYFTPEQLAEISIKTVFSGGKRHHKLVKHILPENYKWIDITIPLKDVFEQYSEYDDITVFTSGDPLFFGFANTIKRELPQATIKLQAYFNSLQSLAHSLVLPYHDMINVSLTGRSWHEFDRVIIEGKEKIGVLTDKNHNPNSIACRLLEYGYTNYKMIVGENMGGENEKINEYSIEEAKTCVYDKLNCIILLKIVERKRLVGIPNTDFKCLEGRPKMMTKMPIRLLSLSLLELYSKSVMWDIGFCTGSVSIDAKIQYPHLKIHSFEVREESRELIKENARKYGALGIESYIGDFFEEDVSNIDKPDAVFIGGHGGRLVEMLGIIKENIQVNGVVVFNSVSEKSRGMFLEGLEKYGFILQNEISIIVEENNPITIMVAK